MRPKLAVSQPITSAGATAGSSFFIPFTRIDKERREVWGAGTRDMLEGEEAVDTYGTVIDYAASKLAFEKWSKASERMSRGKSKGNVREMHQKVAAGKVLTWVPDDTERAIMVGSYCSDDGTWRKIEDGTLTGYSIGMRDGFKVRMEQRGGKHVPVVYDYELIELSYVDAPSTPGTEFTIVRADDNGKPVENETLSPMEQARKTIRQEQKDHQEEEIRRRKKRMEDMQDGEGDRQDEQPAAPVTPAAEGTGGDSAKRVEGEDPPKNPDPEDRRKRRKRRLEGETDEEYKSRLEDDAEEERKRKRRAEGETEEERKRRRQRMEGEGEKEYQSRMAEDEEHKRRVEGETEEERRRRRRRRADETEEEHKSRMDEEPPDGEGGRVEGDEGKPDPETRRKRRRARADEAEDEARRRRADAEAAELEAEKKRKRADDDPDDDDDDDESTRVDDDDKDKNGDRQGGDDKDEGERGEELDACVAAVMKEGKSEDAAWGICNAKFKAAGDEPDAKEVTRQAVEAAKDEDSEEGDKARRIAVGLSFDPARFNCKAARAWAREHLFRSSGPWKDGQLGLGRTGWIPSSWRSVELEPGISLRTAVIADDPGVPLRAALERVRPAIERMVHSESGSIMHGLQALGAICYAIDSELYEGGMGEGAEPNDSARQDVALLTTAAESLLDFIGNELREQFAGLMKGGGEMSRATEDEAVRYESIGRFLNRSQRHSFTAGDEARLAMAQDHGSAHRLLDATRALGATCSVTGCARSSAAGAAPVVPSRGAPARTPATPARTPERAASAGPGATGEYTAYQPDERVSLILSSVHKVEEQVTALCARMDSVGKHVEAIGRQPAPIGRPPAAPADKTIAGPGLDPVPDSSAALERMAQVEPNPVAKEALIKAAARLTIKETATPGRPPGA